MKFTTKTYTIKDDVAKLYSDRDCELHSFTICPNIHKAKIVLKTLRGDRTEYQTYEVQADHIWDILRLYGIEWEETK